MTNTIKTGGGIAGAAIALVLGITTIITQPFQHVDDMPKSNAYFLIYSGHGGIYNGEYQTHGKQSPRWEDGMKVYEGFSCKMLALQLTYRLMEEGIDVTYVNNYNTDMLLRERVAIANKMFAQDKRVIAIFLHHNAQECENGDYVDPYLIKGYTSIETGGATGIEIFTSVGKTTSDTIADYYIFPELENTFPDSRFRYGNGQKNKEAYFYVLTQTQCPAILIEWFFMTTETDCRMIANSEAREAFINALVIGLKKYNNEMDN